MSILRRESREDRIPNNLYKESLKFGDKSETGVNSKNIKRDDDFV